MSNRDESTVRIPVGSENDSRARQLTDAARHAADDGIRVVETGPIGVGALGTAVLLTADGRTTYHVDPTPDEVRSLVEGFADGDLAAGRAYANVEHEPDSPTLPTPDEGPLSVGRRRVLGRAGWTDPTSVDGETFAADRAADAGDDVRERVAELGLLGRGRGDGAPDSPIADEWETTRDTDGDPVVVVNGNESDRRNATDRTLLESDPVAVLDGALAVAELVDAEDVVVYLNENDEVARDRLHDAVNPVAEAIGDGDADRLPEVVTGPDRYIAGEPTMALESLEGNDRLEARLRPPTPAEHGVYGRPTVIHTPRTMAQLRRAILEPDAFDPDDADPGTRLLTVTGDVDAPATVELPTGGSVDAVRGAVDFDGSPKMVCVGGQFGGFTRSLDQPVSAPGLQGADLGTGGAVELFDDSHCALAAIGRRTRFAEDENCGRCVPCREGSKQLTELLREVYGGEFKDGMLRELARVANGTSTCSFGRDMSRTILTGMNRFETEFAAHAEGRCPAGECGRGEETHS